MRPKKFKNKEKEKTTTTIQHIQVLIPDMKQKRTPLSLEKKERGSSKEEGRRMLPSRWRNKNSYANTIPKRAMMKIIVGNFIQR